MALFVRLRFVGELQSAPVLAFLQEPAPRPSRGRVRCCRNIWSLLLKLVESPTPSAALKAGSLPKRARDGPPKTVLAFEGWPSATPLKRSSVNVLVSGKASFSDRCRSEDALVSASAHHHFVDLVAVIHHHEVCDYHRASVGEIDGERAGAIAVHGVSAVCGRVGEISDYFTVDGYGVDLREIPHPVKLGHGHTFLSPGWPLAPQLGAVNLESVVAGNESVVAGGEVALCECGAHSPEREKSQCRHECV